MGWPLLELHGWGMGLQDDGEREIFDVHDDMTGRTLGLLNDWTPPPRFWNQFESQSWPFCRPIWNPKRIRWG